MSPLFAALPPADLPVNPARDKVRGKQLSTRITFCPRNVQVWEATVDRAIFSYVPPYLNLGQSTQRKVRLPLETFDVAA